MSKNKTENAVIKYLILSHLNKKLLRCEKVRKLKWCIPDGGYGFAMTPMSLCYKFVAIHQEGRIPQLITQHFPRHWLVSTEHCLSCMAWPWSWLPSAAQTFQVCSHAQAHCIHAYRLGSFSSIHIFLTMHSFMNLTVLALVAFSVSSALSAPTQ